MKKTLAAGLLALFTAGAANATSVLMEGNYIKTAISNNGTLGWGGTVSPGLQHDATGTGSFGTEDYLTPGSPWEIFSVTSQYGTRTNNNVGSSAISGTVTDLSSSSSYAHYVNWTGATSHYSISTDTYFNDGDERIQFRTTITALTDLSGLQFLRAIDPDPDVNTYGDYNTINGRGYDANGDGDFDDAGDLAQEDWVHSEGESTGLTLGLYSNSDIDHNTGVSSGWSSNASYYLAGNDSGDGDYTIGIAFDLGDWLSGESVSFTYSYVMGENLEDASTPVSVPAPASLLLFAGFAGLLGAVRRKA